MSFFFDFESLPSGLKDSRENLFFPFRDFFLSRTIEKLFGLAYLEEDGNGGKTVLLAAGNCLEICVYYVDWARIV